MRGQIDARTSRDSGNSRTDTKLKSFQFAYFLKEYFFRRLKWN
jgi:hypothetical protein